MDMKYKDSGISWIGKIPDHWKIEKVKYHFNNHKTIVGVNSINYERLALTLNGVVKRNKDDDEGLQPENFDTYQVLKKGELVFKLIDLQNISTSRVGLSHFEGIVSPAYIILSSSGDICPEFAEKYFLSMWNNQIFNYLGDSGVRSSLNASDLLNVPIVFPNIEEQKKISQFLSKEYDKINNLKKNLLEQIEKLDKYKKSLITEKVSKGLMKNVEYKDSNIPWVGSIPSDWEVLKGKYFLKLLSKPTKENDEIITCFRDGTVTLRSNRREEGFTIAEKEIGYQGIDKGDLVVHGMDGFAGAIGISDSRGKASPVLNVLDTFYNKNYIMYYLRSMAYNNVFTALSTGIRVRSCDLRWNKLAELLYTIPSKNEQDEIANFLNEKTSQIDEIIKIKKEEIEKLDNYKKSITFEYVTGKKEVPNE
jgi:type I restriction enzyme S subunit